MIFVLNFLIVSVILFFIGFLGIVLNRKNLLLVLMSIELMFLGINLNFIIFSVFLDDILGQIFSIYVLTVAAGESAIGLAILVVYYKLRNNITVESLQILRG
uniref:NADH dehydrogenase subunit 4L n=1 Tax=Aureoumbra lagunensis TaxID=44058 RepID=A0A7U0QGI2_9STRA|nr:NADH dehydrogenase subunit 4L [Aureoumbra lagunensis]QQW50423.1 NADH dehydrogenase subunit 4L [Aureoumbra lagunensis]